MCIKTERECMCRERERTIESVERLCVNRLRDRLFVSVCVYRERQVERGSV